jgi:hypothetical protein
VAQTVDWTIRNIPAEVHAEVKRLSKQSIDGLSINAIYLKALREWIDLRKKGVIR